jgi:hypothetical protein
VVPTTLMRAQVTISVAVWLFAFVAACVLQLL